MKSQSRITSAIQTESVDYPLAVDSSKFDTISVGEKSVHRTKRWAAVIRKRGTNFWTLSNIVGTEGGWKLLTNNKSGT